MFAHGRTLPPSRCVPNYLIYFHCIKATFINLARSQAHCSPANEIKATFAFLPAFNYFFLEGQLEHGALMRRQKLFVGLLGVWWIKVTGGTLGEMKSLICGSLDANVVDCFIFLALQFCTAFPRVLFAYFMEKTHLKNLNNCSGCLILPFRLIIHVLLSVQSVVFCVFYYVLV